MAMTAFYQSSFSSFQLDEKYYLRELNLEDAEDFFHYYSDPLVSSYTLVNAPTTLKEAADRIQYYRNLYKTQQGMFWAVAPCESNQMIGSIGVCMNNFHHRGEVSYDLDKSYWGRGIMSRALNVLCHYAFSHDVDRLEAMVLKENLNSVKLLQKSNFQYNKILRNYRYVNNKAYDVEQFLCNKTH